MVPRHACRACDYSHVCKSYCRKAPKFKVSVTSWEGGGTPCTYHTHISICRTHGESMSITSITSLWEGTWVVLVNYAQLCNIGLQYSLVHMVKSHEEAYWPDNLSLFSVSCEHFQEPKKTKLWENWLVWFIFMSGECCRIFFVLQGVQKKCKNCHFWSPL